MTIATLDGCLAGMQAPRVFVKAATPTLVIGRPHSFWNLAGSPGIGALDATLNGVVIASGAAIANVPNGALVHVDPGAGNSYLGRLQAQASQPGTLILADRLWHNGGYTASTITAQASTTPTWPARDNAGATLGDGVQIGLEIGGAMGASAPGVVTLAYTNQAGTAGRTTTLIDAGLASAAIGAFHRFGLAAGDTGVRSVQSLTLTSTWTSGTINLVAYRVLAALELTAAQVPNAIDALTAGFPRLFNGTVPFFIFLPSATAAANISGTYVETQG